MAVDPLQCPACAAPVPLVAGDHGRCPHCGATYPIPETYRALRSEAEADARRPEAQALVRALAKPPPAIVRGLAMFSSPLFIAFGLGFWLALGLYIGIIAMPAIGRHVFHVNTYDVLSEPRQMQLALLVPLSILVIGFTVSSWARKRGVVRGGLQAALAAAPPTRPGGPKVCRQCAAPLAPAPGELAARCAYCQADNLVEMPAAWLAKMRSQARTLKREIHSAAKVWAGERRALRRSLLLRFGLFTLLVVVPLMLIFGATADNVSTTEPRASGRPVDLPSWREALTRRTLDVSCHPPPAYRRTLARCYGGRCAIYQLAPLRAGEIVDHVSTNLPPGSSVELQMHDQTFLSEEWVTVASAPISSQQAATTRVPYSGWYRFRVTVPSSDDTLWSYCAAVE